MKKNKNATNVALKIMQDVCQDLNNSNDNKYLNVSEDEKKKEATKDVALMIKHKVLAKLNYDKDNNYLNFSTNYNNVVGASVALMVKHQSNKLGPSGLPGSNPGWGATTFNFFDDELKELEKYKNDLVAFFDNQGNLKLQGGYAENYASP